MTPDEPLFACDMNAIAADQRGAHLATIEKLFSSVQSIVELANGYAFQLPNEPEALSTVTQFISLEMLCCPFLGFGVEVAPEGGPIFLSLTGRVGVKPFIVAEIGDHLPAHLQPELLNSM